jgi:hypothetical protein
MSHIGRGKPSSPRADYTASRKNYDTQLQGVLTTLDSTTVARIRRAFERKGDAVDMPTFGAFPKHALC